MTHGKGCCEIKIRPNKLNTKIKKTLWAYDKKPSISEKFFVEINLKIKLTQASYMLVQCICFYFDDGRLYA